MHQSRHVDPRRAKIRDMGRSVLPSSRRRGARKTLQDLRQRGRAIEHRALTRARSAGCLCEESQECPRCDPVIEYPRGEHKWAIVERRYGDKVAPIVSWAKSETEGMDGAEAYAHMRSIMPSGIIGDHAMTHLEGTSFPERNPCEDFRFRFPTHGDDKVFITGIGWVSADLKVTTEDRLENLARWAIENGSHRRLNNFVRNSGMTVMEIRIVPLDARESSPQILADVERRVARSRRIRETSAHPDRWVSTEGHHLGFVWRPLAGIHDVKDWASDVCRVVGPNYGGGGYDRLWIWASTTGWRDPITQL